MRVVLFAVKFDMEDLCFNLYFLNLYSLGFIVSTFASNKWNGGNRHLSAFQRTVIVCMKYTKFIFYLKIML